MSYNQTCPSDFTCPNGHSDDIRYLEDITNYRQVEGFDEEGNLRVDGLYHTDGYDDGNNPRLSCGECGEEFPIPDDLEIDFV